MFCLLARRFVVTKALAILGNFATISNHYCVTKVDSIHRKIYFILAIKELFVVL